MSSPGSNVTSVPTGGLSVGGAASSEPEKGRDWGDRQGTKKDMEILTGLIKEALRVPSNKGNSV